MNSRALPLRCGIGLRYPHYREVIETLPDIGWIEVHSENFFGGGAGPSMLEKLAAHYPISLHGVGLGLGSVDPPDPSHLAALRHLIERIQPALVSEHLAFNHRGKHYINDLLPIPYTHAMLTTVAHHVDHVQQYLGQRLLLENPSCYLDYPHNEMHEGAFFAALVERTGCGIVLDINNLYVNQYNLKTDSAAIVSALPAHAIAEYHLAGFSHEPTRLIDTHSQAVHPSVWDWFAQIVALFGPRPTLIEWDRTLPTLAILREEALYADTFLMHTPPAVAPPTTPQKLTLTTPPNPSTPSPLYTVPKQASRLEAEPNVMTPMPTHSWQHWLIDVITDTQPLPATSALHVYRRQYHGTLMDTLASTFPVTRLVVGLSFFCALSRDYIAQTPSQSGNVHEYGADFPDFIHQAAPAQAFPYLPDVARLEWAVHTSYYQADHPPLALTALADVPDGEWDRTTLTFATHCQYIESSWPIVSLWHDHQNGAPETLSFSMHQGGETAWVYRYLNTVHVSCPSLAVSAFLKALCAHQSLETATESALAIDANFALDTTLHELFTYRLFSAIMQTE